MGLSEGSGSLVPGLSPEQHAALLLEISQAHAVILVEVLLSHDAFKDTQDILEKLHMLHMIAEVKRSIMFIVFSVLRDRKHKDDLYFSKLAKKLKWLFEKEIQSGLQIAWNAVKDLPGAKELWRKSRAELEQDPFEPYYGSWESISKSVDKTPFAIVGNRISTGFFQEELQETAHQVVVALAIKVGQQVPEYVDNPDKISEYLEAAKKSSNLRSRLPQNPDIDY